MQVLCLQQLATCRKYNSYTFLYMSNGFIPPRHLHLWCFITLLLKLVSSLFSYLNQPYTFFITRCAYAQGRVKRLYVCVCVCVCMCHKNTAVCCLTARKLPRNSSLPLGLAIYILRKMPRKPDESSVECYGHGFLIAARPRGV